MKNEIALELIKYTGSNIVILSPSDSLPLPLKIGYKLKRKNRVESNQFCQSWNSFTKVGRRRTNSDYAYKKDYPVTVVYTGGTTGIPKGAVLSDDSLNALTVEYSTNGMDYSRGGNGQRKVNLLCRLHPLK